MSWSKLPVRKIEFKVDPIVIPPTAITKLESYPYGSGGICDVWKCTMSAKRGTLKVAVKSIRVAHQEHEQEISKASNRIRREAYVWTTLRHDHVLSFEGITDGFGQLPALVSRWMENGTLSDYLEKEFSVLSKGRKLQLVRQVTSGLSYLHGKNVVHGDLTGTNILVDDARNIRLADFGLSLVAAEAENITFGSVQTGNTRWTAPEFLDYSESDDSEPPLKPTKEGDIYSFGCVMLQIFSGKEPYAQIRDVKKVIPAIIHGRDPFQGTKIIMDNDYKELSSQCLSREPGCRPKIARVAALITISDRSIIGVC